MQRKELIMNNIWTRRIGAAGGAVYILLGLLRGDGGNQLGFHSTRAQIVTWIRTNSSLTSGRFVMALVELVGLPCFLVFVAYLSSILRRAEGEFGYLSTVALSAGVLSVQDRLLSSECSGRRVGEGRGGSERDRNVVRFE
jgi:hypothetical protein